MNLSTTPLVFFDIETTGLSPKNEGIIEIAGQKVLDGVIIGKYENFVNPGIPISSGAEAVHGISNDFIEKNGIPVEVVIPEFLTFCRDSVLVGHNIIKFDFPFIKKHAHGLGMTQIDNMLLDTLLLARRTLRLPRYNLGSIASYFGISYEGAHRAMTDVNITRQVFYKLMGNR